MLFDLDWLFTVLLDGFVYMDNITLQIAGLQLSLLELECIVIGADNIMDLASIVVHLDDTDEMEADYD